MTQPKALPENLQTVAYWSAETGFSASTIRRMIATGRLRAYRFGPRLIRVAEADMAAALEQLNTTGYELAHSA